VRGVTVTGESILRFTAFDVPPPGPGFATVTSEIPGLVRKAAGMTALNCVELPEKIVVIAEPLSCTMDCWANPVPFTVSEVSPLPAVTVEGVMEVIAGTGFTTDTEAVPVRVGSAALATFTVTVLAEGGTVGAV
jgi:hypothetical protein